MKYFVVALFLCSVIVWINGQNPASERGPFTKGGNAIANANTNTNANKTNDISSPQLVGSQQQQQPAQNPDEQKPTIPKPTRLVREDKHKHNPNNKSKHG